MDKLNPNSTYVKAAAKKFNEENKLKRDKALKEKRGK